MKDFMKHLPLVLSISTFLMVGMMYFDGPRPGGRQDHASMRSQMAQRMGQMKMRGTRGDSGEMKFEGKRRKKEEQ